MAQPRFTQCTLSAAGVREGYIQALCSLSLGLSAPPVVAGSGLDARMADLRRDDGEVYALIEEVRDIRAPEVVRGEPSDTGLDGASRQPDTPAGA